MVAGDMIEAEYVAKCVPIEGLPAGLVSPDDLDFLGMCLDAVGDLDEPAIELGCWVGRSAVAIARRVKQLHCVDNWMWGTRAEFEKNLHLCSVADKVIIWGGETVSIRAAWSVRCKFLFIDADHTYEGVRNDLQWLAFLIPGGIAAFHDYNVTCDTFNYGVDRALREYFEDNAQFQLFGKSENIIAYQKGGMA